MDGLLRRISLVSGGRFFRRADPDLFDVGLLAVARGRRCPGGGAAFDRLELVPLAVSHTERIALFPNVPTFAELGYPKVVNLPFVSFCAPKGTPDAIVRTLNKAIIEEMAGGPGKPPITSAGRESPPLSPEQLGAFIAEERKRWGDIIIKAKIQA